MRVADARKGCEGCKGGSMLFTEDFIVGKFVLGDCGLRRQIVSLPPEWHFSSHTWQAGVRGRGL